MFINCGFVKTLERLFIVSSFVLIIQHVLCYKKCENLNFTNVKNTSLQSIFWFFESMLHKH